MYLSKCGTITSIAGEQNRRTYFRFVGRHVWFPTSGYI